ncbi:MAG: phospho-N-acetylmuramoyl-pentapeptide-transferase [Puniceicoccales bacterium]|nr:phospho-N-acetylmuramoyl-pentapeptide-transferase [Puniceicoccales bacterium]
MELQDVPVLIFHRSLGAFFTALLLTLVSMPFAIAVLRRLGLEQKFRGKEEVRDLADLHAHKIHTPTMGGVILWATTFCATIPWVNFTSSAVGALAVFTGSGAIGLVDDWKKIRGKSSRGVSGKKKLLLQAVVVGGLLAGLFCRDRDGYRALHELWIPLLRTPLFHLPTVLLCIFAFFVVAGSSNAVNLTDGADGLAAGCSLTTAIALAIFSGNAGNATTASLLSIAFVPGAGELCVLLGALCGALCSFLCFNGYPARIFMGDSGSLAIGGLFGAIALLIRQPFLLAVVGCVFVAEALSVIGQVYYFKLSGGRRIFRMAPLHHHFELGGCPETRVVLRLWVLSVFGAAAGLALQGIA